MSETPHKRLFESVNRDFVKIVARELPWVFQRKADLDAGAIATIYLKAAEVNKKRTVPYTEDELYDVVQEIAEEYFGKERSAEIKIFVDKLNRSRFED